MARGGENGGVYKGYPFLAGHPSDPHFHRLRGLPDCSVDHDPQHFGPGCRLCVQVKGQLAEGVGMAVEGGSTPFRDFVRGVPGEKGVQLLSSLLWDRRAAKDLPLSAV